VPTAENRRELARFLRTRRERITPAQVGLPANTRRRIRGLRREEVAVLAGLSPTWYTYLEQARDIGQRLSTAHREIPDHKAGLALALVAQGELHTEMRKYDEALKSLTRAREILLALVKDSLEVGARFFE